MAAETNRHVLIYGLEVRDDALYARYRAAMAPILQRYGGSFGYDFVVSKVLKSEATAPINRLFTMRFPSAQGATDFFADPAYLTVRAELFEGAVAAITKVASFDEAIPATTG
jgi:uncharacterized protein (DUF1330 family)